ncbi:hypothetical protein HFV02_12590 [Acidithiobacillus caldus]|nr:hypothetical protein [Acidithiobacillus caldus]
MNKENIAKDSLCISCVYFPPNLPEDKYPPEDWLELQSKQCSFDLTPGSDECQGTRKTSCSLVDLSCESKSASRK